MFAIFQKNGRDQEEDGEALQRDCNCRSKNRTLWRHQGKLSFFLHTLRTSRQKHFLYKVYLESCTLWGHQGKLFCCKNITQILAHFDNGNQDSRWTKLYFQQLRFYSEIQIFLNLANDAILYFQRLKEKYKKILRAANEAEAEKYLYLYLYFQ